MTLLYAIGGLVALVVLLVLLVLSRIKVAGPNQAFIVTGRQGREVTSDKVVLATGGTARQLPIPGGDLDSVLELRTREDADRLRALLKPGARLVIIGAGLIGAEVASSALPFGAEHPPQRHVLLLREQVPHRLLDRLLERQ